METRKLEAEPAQNARAQPTRSLLSRCYDKMRFYAFWTIAPVVCFLIWLWRVVFPGLSTDHAPLYHSSHKPLRQQTLRICEATPEPAERTAQGTNQTCRLFPTPHTERQASSLCLPVRHPPPPRGDRHSLWGCAHHLGRLDRACKEQGRGNGAVTVLHIYSYHTAIHNAAHTYRDLNNCVTQRTSFKYRIAIAGNHDMCCVDNNADVKEALSNFIYLEGECG